MQLKTGIFSIFVPVAYLWSRDGHLFPSISNLIFCLSFCYILSIFFLFSLSSSHTFLLTHDLLLSLSHRSLSIIYEPWSNWSNALLVTFLWSKTSPLTPPPHPSFDAWFSPSMGWFSQLLSPLSPQMICHAFHPPSPSFEDLAFSVKASGTASFFSSTTLSTIKLDTAIYFKTWQTFGRKGRWTSFYPKKGEFFACLLFCWSTKTNLELKLTVFWKSFK